MLRDDRAPAAAPARRRPFRRAHPHAPVPRAARRTALRAQPRRAADPDPDGLRADRHRHAVPVLPLGLLALLFVGLASNGYWALNNTMVLGNTAPEYYGRVMSVYMMSWSFSSFAALPGGKLADALGVQTM